MSLLNDDGAPHHSCAFSTSHQLTNAKGDTITIDVARANPADLAGFVRAGYAMSADDAAALSGIATMAEDRSKLLVLKEEAGERRELFLTADTIRRNLRALGHKAV